MCKFSGQFCYICGEITFSSQKRTMTPLVKAAYQHYFGMNVGDQAHVRLHYENGSKIKKDLWLLLFLLYGGA